MLLFKARPRKDPALSAQLTPSERRMMATLRDTRAEIQGKFRARRADIMRALLHSPITQIVRLIPTDPWYEAQAMLQAELQAELLDAGRRVKLPPIQKATIAYRFDADRPEAAGWAAKEAGSLIQDITNDQVTFVRDIVSRSQFGEFTPAQAARVFRQMEDGLGLTVQQSEWVENFRQRRITDAMSRGRSYEQAESEAAKPTARYADRVYRYRTETIARTEIMRASNEGRNQAWAQGIEGGWIAPDSLKKWSVERDGRECSICRPLGDLEPIPINASFPQGDPPVHPNCRCTVVLTDEIPADLAQMTDDELEAEIGRLLDTRSPMPSVSGDAWQAPEDLSDDEARRAYAKSIEDDYTRTWQDSVKIDGSDVRVTVEQTDDGRWFIASTVFDADANTILTAGRYIDPRTKIVQHDIMEVRSKYQGQGIASRANRQFFELYRARGMKAVTLEAGLDVGGYTWAKQGFDWDIDKYERPEDISNFGIFRIRDAYQGKRPSNVGGTHEGIPSDTAEYERARALEERFFGPQEQWPTPIEIAMLGWSEGKSTWAGKEALMGSNWFGRLEL